MSNRGFAAIAVLAAGVVFGAGASAADGDIERGKSISNTCIACHGPGGNSHIPAMYPSIAGRDADTLAEMLMAYRSGDIQNPQMTPQAQHLSDEDIADLAAFFAAQEAR